MRNSVLLCIALLLIAVPASATIIVDSWNTNLCELAMAGPGQAEGDSDSFGSAAFDGQGDMFFLQRDLSGGMFDKNGNAQSNFVASDTMMPLNAAGANLHADSLGNETFGTVPGIPAGFGLAGTQAPIHCDPQEDVTFCLGVLPEPASIVVWGLLGAGCAGGTMASRRRRRAPWSDETRQSIHQIIDRGRISS